MSIWATDPPPSDLDEPYPRDEDEDEDDQPGDGCAFCQCGARCAACDGPCSCAGDDIERADLDAATRADEALDEEDTDYDGPEWV